jgi:hypothetical protein
LRSFERYSLVYFIISTLPAYGLFAAFDASPHPVMVSQHEDDEEKFNGSNWQTLNRQVALAKFQFLQDEDYDKNAPRQCAYLASGFAGPALDWVASTYTIEGTLYDSFDGFVDRTREAFGIADNNITSLLRRELDCLSWNVEVPVFFAEFDRLTHALGITTDETKIALVNNKLPAKIKGLFAEQCLQFANYDTLRERCNGMWAMDPNRSQLQAKGKKPRCGSCGKKGHTAADCKGAKN